MRVLSVIFPLTFVISTLAIPHPTDKRDIARTDDVILFDAPAFQSPTDPSVTIVSQQALVYARQIDTAPLTSVLKNVFNVFGLGDELATAVDRLKLFAAVGLSGKEMQIAVQGCSTPMTLPKTSGLPDLGLVASNVSVGKCTTAARLTTTLQASFQDSSFTSTVFPSGPDGFGVISDIDDTVKISNVLQTIPALKAALFESPTAVAGMPELYASLAKSLNSPQFIYVSGSPMQFYPFLHDFINTQFSASAGPIITKNLTIADISGLVNLLTDKSDTLNYKVGIIDQIHGMYPGKKFLTVGDSTQSDPEVYATAFKKYGNFIQCIWIHKVDGADNSDTRFATAFKDVPSTKFRIYTDADIAGLANIDVAGGKC
ncbi:hypothetical protein QCA50_011545 [Cerrena zonata]|uniref:Phosphatidate phosphatase APP1 catalytic domain-containing protein n=1 Tax=Cerrena zonata TaxID=2478898 RepID=A0AAW0G691_9APHY